MTFSTPVANKYSFIHSGIGAVSSAKKYVLRLSTYGTTQQGIVRAYIRKSTSPYNNLVATQTKSFGIGRTDHEFFQIDNGETIKFPNPHEKEIRGYELDNMLMKAGMRRPDYWREKLNTQNWKKGCPRTPSKPPVTQ